MKENSRKEFILPEIITVIVDNNDIIITSFSNNLEPDMME